jgi:hypothetical protein
MRCQDFQIHLLDHSQDSPHPHPVLAAAMTEHLSGCPECKEFKRLWQGLDELAQPEAPAGMSSRFRERLALELAIRKSQKPFISSWWLPLSVAAALLLSVGVILGFSLRSGNDRIDPALASLRNGSVADRMEAIALVNTRTPGQGDIVSALIERVSHDPSLDVRLSAVEALYLFGTDPGLSHRIEVILPGQTRPEVQLALIDLLGALRQKRAAEALRRLMNEDQLPREARQRAEQRFSQMNL